MVKKTVFLYICTVISVHGWSLLNTKMMKSGLFVSGFLLLVMFGCGSSQQQLAAIKISIAEACLTKGDTAIALLHLDSIPKIYPEAVLEIKRAQKVSNQIYTSKLNGLFEKKEETIRIVESLIKEFSPDKGEFEKYTSQWGKLGESDLPEPTVRKGDRNDCSKY